MHPLSPVVHLWIGVVAFGWFVLTSVVQGDPMWSDVGRLTENLAAVPWWMLLLGGGLVVGLAVGYWGWWTTKFVIDDREFRLENTGAFQESKRIAFGRIQSVDVSQPFAARLLGLAQVKIDVGSESGATLSFLRRDRATEVRDYLMARAHGRAASTADPARAASAWDDTAAGDQILIRLRPGDIILGAIASIEFFVIALAVLIPFGLGTLFGWPSLLVGGGVVPLVLALAGYLSRHLITQFNYTLARTPAGLRITRGLTTLRSQTIPAHRVQSLQISQPAPWRLFNRARLHVTVLGLGDVSEGEELSTSNVYLPIGTPAQVQVAIAALWPGLNLDRLRFAGPAPAARWLNPLEWSWRGHAVDDQVIAIRSGWSERKQLIIPHARAQSVQVSQGPVERRLGLAGLTVHTTAVLGTSKVAHLTAADARRLAFDELDRARAARVEELLHPPGQRLDAPLPLHGGGYPAGAWPDPGRTPASGPADVWLPPTAPLPR